MPSPEQSAFYDRIDPYNLYPLWEAIDELQSAVPVTDATPHVWRFDDIRPRLLEAADLVGAEAADRRTLMLENPSMRGRRRIAEALYSGLQCIMPGEVAKPHRHTASAMRMVIERFRVALVEGREGDARQAADVMREMSGATIVKRDR